MLKAPIRELEDLHSEMEALIGANQAAVAQIRPENQSSAANLLHYLALRRRDVRSSRSWRGIGAVAH